MYQRNKLLWLIGLVIVIIGLMAYRSSEPNPKEDKELPAAEAPATTSASKIKSENLIFLNTQVGQRAMTKEIIGRVIPKNQTTIVGEVQGKMLPGNVLLKEGITFRKNDLLINIDAREFQLGLEAQRSAFLNTLTGLMPDLKSDYPDSYPHWLNYIQQYDFGKTLPPLPSTLSDEEKFFVTTNQVYSSYYSIKAQEERLKKYKITAPYSGMITQSNVDKGSLITPGQPLLNIVSNRTFEVETGVDLETIQHLKVGDRVKFTSNEYQGEWTGKVKRINDLIDPKTQNIPVFFEISGKGIRPGLYLEGTFQIKSFEEVTCRPHAWPGFPVNCARSQQPSPECKTHHCPSQ
ncbi:MAG: HlyD family efflux transporter periplasmic adaptor subunit [Bacteroidota bacterium]